MLAAKYQLFLYPLRPFPTGQLHNDHPIEAQQKVFVVRLHPVELR